MYKIKILNFIIIIFFITINANSKIDEFSISFVLGDFKTLRNGKIIKLQLGDMFRFRKTLQIQPFLKWVNPLYNPI